MSEYSATIHWQHKTNEDFLKGGYSRSHLWQFDGGAQVNASSSPHIVPLPYSIEANVDPEEAFVASLSSCHMLFFLSLACKHNYIVEEYIDNAIGTMNKNSEGKMAMTKVKLRPIITFSDKTIAPDDIQKLHHKAHELCFIANSVKTEVVVELTA